MTNTIRLLTAPTKQRTRHPDMGDADKYEGWGLFAFINSSTQPASYTLTQSSIYNVDSVVLGATLSEWKTALDINDPTKVSANTKVQSTTPIDSCQIFMFQRDSSRRYTLEVTFPYNSTVLQLKLPRQTQLQQDDYSLRVDDTTLRTHTSKNKTIDIVATLSGGPVTPTGSCPTCPEVPACAQCPPTTLKPPSWVYTTTIVNIVLVGIFILLAVIAPGKRKPL